MKNTLYLIMLAGCGLNYFQSASAACNVQSVLVSSGKIESASPEKNQEIVKKSEGNAPAEWVKISLYDLRNNHSLSVLNQLLDPWAVIGLQRSRASC